MQLVGNAGNECSLSEGLNRYISIGLTDKMRNRNAEYYLQARDIRLGYTGDFIINIRSIYKLIDC